MSFQIITDSSANLTDALIDALNIEIISLSYFVGEKQYESYVKGVKTDYSGFYSMLRSKESVTTSLVSYERCREAIEPLLKEGKDVLYIAFSSGLSGTYQSAKTCVDDLQKEYPDRKVFVVDSLCASMGEGLLVYHAAQQQKAGKTIEETVAWLEENKLNLCHWFTVDDLFFLKRGGRVSSTTAVVGTVLGIKPVMHVDNEGKLILVSKARGRRNALNALVDRMAQTAIDPKNQVIFISHGDCLSDAEYVADQVKKRFGVKEIVINYVDPVIGAHSGPGTLALFFLGSVR